MHPRRIFSWQNPISLCCQSFWTFHLTTPFSVIYNTLYDKDISHSKKILLRLPHVLWTGSALGVVSGAMVLTLASNQWVTAQPQPWAHLGSGIFLVSPVMICHVGWATNLRKPRNVPVIQRAIGLPSTCPWPALSWWNAKGCLPICRACRVSTAPPLWAL